MGGPRILSWNDVQAIRRRGARGESPRQIAKSYAGYLPGNIAKIIAGQIWTKEPTVEVRIGGKRIWLAASEIARARAEVERAAAELASLVGAP